MLQIAKSYDQMAAPCYDNVNNGTVMLHPDTIVLGIYKCSLPGTQCTANTGPSRYHVVLDHQ